MWQVILTIDSNGKIEQALPFGPVAWRHPEAGKRCKGNVGAAP
jgi:hypothetical protein